MRRILSLSLARLVMRVSFPCVLLAACGPKGEPRQFPPRPANHPMAVFQSLQDLDAPDWIELGRVTTRIEGSLPPADGGIEELKAAGRKLGGDAIVLGADGSSAGSSGADRSWIRMSGGMKREATVIRLK